MGDERSRSVGAGAFAADERAGDRAGTRLAAGGNGKPAELLDRRTGAALRSQHHVGNTPSGVGGVTARSGAATSARGQDRRADRHAFPGAGGARQRGPLPADGASLRRATVDHAASRRALPGLAPRQRRGARTPPRRAPIVSQSPTTTYHVGKGTSADRRHRPTRVGAPGRIANGPLRGVTAKDPTHHPVINRTLPTNRGAIPC